MSKKYFFSVLMIIPVILITTSISAQVINVDKVINLGQPVNSSGDDFSPSLTPDGKNLYFNSKCGSKYQNIYVSRNENGSWTAPVTVNEINSEYNDESPHITSDGGYIFFSSDRDGSFELPKDQEGQIRISFDIYVSKNINGRWETPIQLPGNVNTENHERTPSLSLDSETLFYTSMPFGDISRARIIKAAYNNGEFINPGPLPAPVNVNAQDTGFVPSSDGKGYFFSSKREGGYGGWDMYYTKYENSKFTEPINLGPDINSPKNEINLSIIKDTIYFCSDRDGGYGSYDIYTAKIAVIENALKIIVRDKKTKKPIETELKLSTKVKENDNEETFEIKKKTDEKGEAIVKYNPLVKNLDIYTEKEGYLPMFEEVEIASLKGKPKIIELIPIEKEASFEIRSIYFDFESAKIKPESYTYLDALADYLMKHQSMHFEIIGHTDLHGSDEFNDKLSLARANSVLNYLVKKGLDKNRFSVKGIGKRFPVVPQISPEFDEKNRRTEFKLMEK